MKTRRLKLQIPKKECQVRLPVWQGWQLDREVEIDCAFEIVALQSIQHLELYLPKEVENIDTYRARIFVSGKTWQLDERDEYMPENTPTQFFAMSRGDLIFNGWQ